MKADSKGLNVIHDAGRLAWVHCHGKMNPVLDRFIEMGVDCLNPVEPPPMGDILLSDAKRRAGGGTSIAPRPPTRTGRVCRPRWSKTIASSSKLAGSLTDMARCNEVRSH